MSSRVKERLINIGVKIVARSAATTLYLDCRLMQAGAASAENEPAAFNLN
jgi:hypothetical protein